MTALTPAQVREHARALILMRTRTGAGRTIADYVGVTFGHNPFPTDTYNAIRDAVDAARITVNWDEETDAEYFQGREDAEMAEHWEQIEREETPR